MSGKVWEWCADWYDEGSYRVIRGGSWNNDAENCRTANRNNDHPDNRNDGVGFRLVFVPQLMSKAGWLLLHPVK